MEKHRIVVTMPMTAEQRERLEAGAPEADFVYYPDDEEACIGNPALYADAVRNATVILGEMPAKLLSEAKKLRFMQTSSAGVGGYIAALDESVTLCNATGAYSLGISEAMLTMALMLKRKMPLYHEQQKAHVWNNLGRVSSIQDAVVLSVGLGSIGGEFARKCKLLGAYTIGVRRACQTKPDWLDELYMIGSLDALLPKADVVALSMPETEKTRRLFDANRLALMKKEAILLNVGRGSAVDTDALCAALKNGTIAGAGLDVVDPEPLPAEHPLWEAPNLILTPHVTGGYTLPQTLTRITELAIENLRRYIAGEPLLNQVNRSEGYAVPESKYQPDAFSGYAQRR